MSVWQSLKALLHSNDRRFVGLLGEQAELAVGTLRLLEEFGNDPSAPAATLAAIKENERAGDELRRILIDELLHTYATPFDREDLFELSGIVDDILDAANETIIELTIFEIVPPPGFAEMARILCDGARHIQAAVSDLLDHPAVAAEHAVRAKRSENRIDSHYHQAVHQVLDGSTDDVFRVLRIREVYRHLKNSADCIDRAADKISIIVIKRS